MDAFDFPKQFAQALHANNGSFASFVDYENVEETITPAFLCKYSCPDNIRSCLALLIQNLTHFLGQLSWSRTQDPWFIIFPL